jgi:hypothetical protein
MSFQIDESMSNHICLECNNSLVLFHMFKRDVKKYSDFKKYIDKLDLLVKLEHFLDTQEDTFQLKITQDSTKWSVAFEQNEDEMVEFDGDDIIEDTANETVEIQIDSTQDESIVSQSKFEPSSFKKRKLNKINDLKQDQIVWISKLTKAW